jgi:hypothetical protein
MHDQSILFSRLIVEKIGIGNEIASLISVILCLGIEIDLPDESEPSPLLLSQLFAVCCEGHQCLSLLGQFRALCLISEKISCITLIA